MKIRFKSLQTFLAFVITVTAAGLLIMTGNLAYFLQYAQSEAESRRHVQNLMATVQHTAAVAAFANNAEIGRDVVNGLMRNDVIFRTSIRSNDKPIAFAERAQHGQTLPPVMAPVYSPFDNTEQIGELIVEPDADWVARRAQHSAIAMVAWMAALIALTAVVSAHIFRRLLSRPLVAVVKQMSELIPGTPERLTVADHLERNEIGVLIDGFNHLLDDMAVRLETERQLRAQVEQVKKRLSQIFDSTPAGILVIDVAGRLKGANPAMAALIGMTHSSLLDHLDEPILERIFADPDTVWQLIGDATRAGMPMQGDFPLCDNLGTPVRWVHGLFIVGFETETPESIDCVLYDVTERKLSEETARRDALHDHLTDLLNRRGSEITADRMLREASRKTGNVAFLLIDLDGFKAINDQHGHDAGDLVLCITAQRLRDAIRSRGDVAARLGGDEFLIMLSDCNSDEGITRVATKLIDAVSLPIELENGITVQVGASIGIARYPKDGSNRDELLVVADSAMYAVKRRGKNGFSFSDRP